MNPQNSPSQDHNNNNLPLIPANRYFPFSRNLRGYYLHSENRKKIIKKYYAKKILYVEKKTDLTAATNRSKYFLHCKINAWYISYLDFKSLANLILLKTDIILKYHVMGHPWQSTRPWYIDIHPLQLKKALHRCQNPKANSPQLKHLQHLFHLKSLTLRVTNGSSLSKVSKAIRKLNRLQSLHVKYLSDYDESDPNLPIKLKTEPKIYNADDKRGWGFFYKISKLPRLQRLSLQTSLRTLQGQSSLVQQDFANFYSKSHRFKIDTAVYVSSGLDIKELTAKNMASILTKADSLSIRMGASKPANKNLYTCQDIQSHELSEQENQKISKQGERPVRLYPL